MLQKAQIIVIKMQILALSLKNNILISKSNKFEAKAMTKCVINRKYYTWGIKF